MKVTCLSEEGVGGRTLLLKDELPDEGTFVAPEKDTFDQFDQLILIKFIDNLEQGFLQIVGI